MFENFTLKAQKVLEAAKKAMNELGSAAIGTEHLLIGLISVEDGTAGKVLQLHEIDEQKTKSLLERLMIKEDISNVNSRTNYTPKAIKIIEDSYIEAEKAKSGQVGTVHILLAIIKEPNTIASRLLKTMEVDLRNLYMELSDVVNKDKHLYLSNESRNKGNTKQSDQTATPMLNSYSQDITQLAKMGKLDTVIGRETEIQRMIQTLSRRTKNNPCLVGEPGVGKTALVEALAIRIVEGNVPEIMKNKRVLTLDLAAMIAGSKYRGEFEERIKTVLAEVIENRNTLLFIDEIHTIIGAGGAEGAIDAANILKPSLARGEIQLIGATTLNEYRKHIEKDAALERRFQPIFVKEPDEKEAIDILQGVKWHYEVHHGVKISEAAIKASVKLSLRYINDRCLPDKAIDLIDEAAARIRVNASVEPLEVKDIRRKIEQLKLKKEELIKSADLETAAEISEVQQKEEIKLKTQLDTWQASRQKLNNIVDVKQIEEVVSLWTKIPLQTLQEEEANRLLHMEEKLHEQVIGQSEAVTAVAKAIRRGRVGLKDPNRPIGSFLFLGPTGVGKTELSKALAKVLFGMEDAIIRVDMSEYMEKHSISKIIGSPPGYVGYDEGGQLSERVRRNPYSVILFDEIEKAHSDIFNILLQILDEGQMTDAQGRFISFKNTIIIMTSNVGAKKIIEPRHLGFVTDKNEDFAYNNMKKSVMADVKELFKPELINRIDEIIVFHALSEDNINDIVKLMLKDIAVRIQENIGISLNFDFETVRYIVKKGYDEKYGARPLRRSIQTEIEDMLAEQILENKILSGNSVEVNVQDDKISFFVQK
jgi:ATPases with chaperone activity, ATP-binding subunit